MFGTIGRARPKDGKADEFNRSGEDWARDIRPKVPGRVLTFAGKSVNRPDEIIFIALMQDEATYRNLAEMPEQHTYFERISALVDGDITWDDIEVDVINDD